MFSKFATATSEILLTLGVPAYRIFGSVQYPNEDTIQKLDKGNIPYKNFQEKKPSELYEFYIRKCTLLKSLYAANSLILPNVKLSARCKNIEYATRALIIMFEQGQEA